MDLIKLEEMEFFAYHGYFDEEQKLGNRYSVSVVLSTDLTTASISDLLADTIDYGQIYKIVSLRMSVSARLLERLGLSIAEDILSKFGQVSSCKVEICKHNPPLSGLCKRAVIVIEKIR